MPTRDPELYKWSKEWVRNACAYLTQKVQASEEIPFELREGIKLDEEHPNQLRRVWVHVPLPFWFILNHEKHLKEEPGYQEIIQAMKTNPQVGQHLDTLVGTARGATRLEANEVLYRLLGNLWKVRQSFAFDEQEFESLYVSWETFFYSPTIPTQLLAPLENFTSTEPEIDFGDGLKIRKLANQEIEELYLENNTFRDFYHYKVTSMRFAMLLECEEDKVIGEGRVIRVQTVTQVIEDLCSALRIFKPGFVGYKMIQVRQGTHDWAQGSPSFFYMGRNYFGPKYEVAGAQIGELKDFWQTYSRKDWQQYKFLTVAIDRLNLGTERLRAEDRIIDSVICLESLFLHDSGEPQERGELRYRLALRGARFLAEDRTQRKRIFDELKQAYDVRSAIVHGGEYKLPKKADGTEMPISEFVASIETHVRNALRKFLGLAREHREGRLVDWDRLVLDG